MNSVTLQGILISSTSFFPLPPLVSARIGHAPRHTLITSTHFPTIQEHHTILVVQQEGQKQFEINRTKVFSIRKYPRVLFTGCVLQMAESMSLVQEQCFAFNLKHRTKTTTKALYLTCYITWSKTSRREEP